MEKKYTTPSSRTGRMAAISQDANVHAAGWTRSYSLPPLAARAASPCTSAGLVAEPATIASVAQAHALKQAGEPAWRLRTRAHDLARGADASSWPRSSTSCRPCRCAAQDQARSRRAWTSLAVLGGSAGHVQGGQGQLLAHVVGQLGVQAGLEQDGLGLHVHAVDIGVDGLDLVDASEESGTGRPEMTILSPTFRSKPGFFCKSSPMSVTAPMNIPPEPVTGFCMLATLGDDVQDHLADLLLVAAASLSDLSEGSGVDVQGGHVADDLVGVAPWT